MPEALESDPVFLERMEAIRCAGSVAMGLAPDVAAAAEISSVPKVAMIVAPRQMTTLSGRALEPSDMSLGIRMISISQPHRAVPITLRSRCASMARLRTGWCAPAMARLLSPTPPVRPWSMRSSNTPTIPRRHEPFMARFTPLRGGCSRATCSIDLPNPLRKRDAAH